MSTADTKQGKKIQPRQILTEADEKDVFDRIDLSNLESLLPNEHRLNYREEVEDPQTGYYAPPGQPIEYIYLDKIGMFIPRYIIEHEDRRPDYKNLAGQWVTPTRIDSLLTQNPSTVIGTGERKHELDGPRRPASQTTLWQTDDDYYIKQAEKNLASFLAATEPNYYVVEGDSPHRLKFKCPHQTKGARPNYYNDTELLPWKTDVELPKEQDDLSIYIDPDNNRARWACPRCTIEASKQRLSIEECKVLGVRYRRGHTFAIFHDIPRPLRTELADDGIIPGKEYKYEDRLTEAPKLLKYIANNQGLSFNELDKGMNWPHGTAGRIINTQLKNKVNLKKARKGYKGYRVYIKH